MGIRILVIEDDEEIAVFIVRGLREEVADRALLGQLGQIASAGPGLRDLHRNPGGLTQPAVDV